MDEELAERLDAEEINLDRILEIKIDIIHDLMAEIEFISSHEFFASSIRDRMIMLSDVRTSVSHIEKTERILNSMMVKLFDHHYHNAMEALDNI